jgi:cytochrome c peroxidase
MMNQRLHTIILLGCLFGITWVTSCRKKETDFQYVYNPTPYDLGLPSHFPPMVIPLDNPLTNEGVLLGRHLFWDKRLSGDNTMACANCHLPEHAFSDPSPFSFGILGEAGTRHSMPLQNLAYASNYFWDGRALTLEEQVLLPVQDPIEMHSSWPEALSKIKSDERYVQLFYEAFGVTKIDSLLAAKAMAQFLRTMVSGNSKYDKVIRGETTFTPQENFGFDLFNSLDGGDCFHCHGGTLSTDHSFKNNGLDVHPADIGRGAVTGIAADNFTFKVPSLRNLAYSAPYMHDGRFATLDEVINFYSVGVEHFSPNISPLMEFSSQGGVQLNPQERLALKAFLLTFTDDEFIENPKFRNPWP